MIVAAYRTPSMKTRDARVLDMISTILSDGKSSRLYKKIVDDKKMALQVGAFSFNQEDYGSYILYGMPQGDVKPADILKEVDEEIVKLQTELISEKDLTKLKNKYENQLRERQRKRGRNRRKPGFLLPSLRRCEPDQH
jgi:zinc protease